MTINTMSLVVFANDPISAYYVKGEIKERYFNPCNLFDKVHIISPSDADIEPDEVQMLAGKADLTIHPVGHLSVSAFFHPRVGLRKILRTRRRVSALLKDFQPHVIRAYNPLMQGLLAVHCGRRLGIPTIISVHNDYDKERLFARKRMGPRDHLEFTFGSKLTEAYCLRSADIIVAVTSAIGDYAKRHNPKRISVIYNRVDTEQFSPKKQVRQGDEFRILSVSRLSAQKNPACLIRAMKTVDASLLLIGDGELHDPLVTMARKLGVESKVGIIRAIPHSDIHNYYNSSDIFAIASHYEGFCIPVLEAMACGLPIVAADILPIREIVGDAGILLPHNPDDFAKTFRLLMTNDELRYSLGNKARQRALRFNGKVMEEAEANLYRQLIAGRNQVSPALPDQFKGLERGPGRHLHRTRMAFVSNLVRELHQNKERLSVIDLGCGDGVVASYIERALSTDDLLICVDVVPERLRRAKKHCRIAKVIASDVQALPITNGRFNLAVLHHVIEHLSDGHVALNECRRVLRRDGTALLGIPNEGGIIGTALRRIHRQEYLRSEHVSFYSTEHARNLLEASGFSVTDVSLFGFIFPFFPIHYWILRNAPLFSLGHRLSQVLRFTADSVMLTSRRTSREDPFQVSEQASPERRTMC